MDPTINGERSFDGALADLRATLAAHTAATRRTDLDKNTDVSRLVAQIGRAARALGLKPERAVIAFSTAWEREVTPEALHTPVGANDAADLTRYRAIGTLLDAYFAGE
jgi:hypothetical protein